MQTYRLHQGADLPRRKLAIAQRLADFDVQLVQTLRRQAEANQVGPAEVVLAEVESQAAAQQLETARQEYAVALAELRQQFAAPQAAGRIEPAGALRVPADSLLGAKTTAPIGAGEPAGDRHRRGQVGNSRAALCLARADRIPVPSVGPAYEHERNG